MKTEVILFSISIVHMCRILLLSIDIMEIFIQDILR